MASAAGMRPHVVAVELAGEITGFAIVGAVGGRREEVALRWAGEGRAKETDFVVNII
jgi:hypothetical protein